MSRRSLTDEVHDTPVQRRTDVDAECLSFLQSLPPPPMTEARQRVAYRPRTDSDQFDIAQIEAEVRGLVARQAAEALAKERARAASAEAALEAAQNAVMKTREKRIDWAMGILGKIVEWAVISIIVWLLSKK